MFPMWKVVLYSSSYSYYYFCLFNELTVTDISLWRVCVCGNSGSLLTLAGETSVYGCLYPWLNYLRVWLQLQGKLAQWVCSQFHTIRSMCCGFHSFTSGFSLSVSYCIPSTGWLHRASCHMYSLCLLLLLNLFMDSALFIAAPLRICSPTLLGFKRLPLIASL